MKKRRENLVTSLDGKRKMTAEEFDVLFDKGSDEIDEFIDWSKVELTSPPAKRPITLRIDPDVLDWFKSLGKGYQTRMNAVLRAYKEAKQR
jgi:uncharacterized protein (DUF4415 family)